MTERYTLFELEKLRDRFTLPQGVPSGVKKNYNISPTQHAPVITLQKGIRTMERMQWGFIATGAKDSNGVFRYKTYSAKSEKIFEKPTWEQAIQYSRCLIPANGFYEWIKLENDKQAYYIHPKDQSLFAFAGIHSSWINPKGEKINTYAIITTLANDEMLAINNRMPVILDPKDEDAWLDPATEMYPLYDIMRPYTDEKLLIVPVSPAVHSTKKNTPELIVPTHLHSR